MANMWIRDNLLERLNTEIDLGPGVHDKQDVVEFLLNFYAKNKNKVPQEKGSEK